MYCSSKLKSGVNIENKMFSPNVEYSMENAIFSLDIPDDGKQPSKIVMSIGVQTECSKEYVMTHVSEVVQPQDLFRKPNDCCQLCEELKSKNRKYEREIECLTALLTKERQQITRLRHEILKLKLNTLVPSDTKVKDKESTESPHFPVSQLVKDSEKSLSPETNSVKISSNQSVEEVIKNSHLDPIHVEPFVNQAKHSKVVLIGDEYLKGFATMLKEHLPSRFLVESSILSGGYPSNKLIQKAQTAASSLDTTDFIVVSVTCRLSEQYFKVFIINITNFVSSSMNTNVILLNVPNPSSQKKKRLAFKVNCILDELMISNKHLFILDAFCFRQGITTRHNTFQKKYSYLLVSSISKYIISQSFQ